MDKFVFRRQTGHQDPENVASPNRKRASEEPDLHDSVKKSRNDVNETLNQNNYYSPLQNDDNGDVIPPNSKNVRTRKPRIPPITLHQELVNPKKTYEQIQSWAKKPVYFKQSGNVRYIYATEKDDFIKIKEHLNLIKFQWTSHAAEDDLHKKLILKGVDKSYTQEEVYDDLKTQFSSVVKVKQLSKTSEDGQPIAMGVYVVYFDWNTILSVPQKVVKYCCFHRISWEHLRKKRQNNVKQCYNCQRFGHHSSQCGLQNRCVKCVEDHKVGECKKIKGTDNAVCCNCGKDHPANYRGCAKAIEYLNNTKKPSKHTNPRRKPSNNNRNGIALGNGPASNQQVKRKLSFSSAVKISNGQQKTPKRVKEGSGVLESSWPARGLAEVSNIAVHTNECFSEAQGFSFITGEIKSNFGVPFSVLQRTVREFLPVYRVCTDKDQKKLLLLEFLFRISP